MENRLQSRCTVGKNIQQALRSAELVSSDNIKGDKNLHPEIAKDVNGTKLWSEVLIFALKDGHPVRVTSMSERAEVLRHYRDTGEFREGYTPFNRRIVPELSPAVFDALQSVNEDGSDVDFNSLSDEEKSERDEALRMAQEIMADSDETFSFSNLPLYENAADGRFHRVSDHRICSWASHRFLRFRRFVRPGDVKNLGVPAISPWPFAVDYTGIDTAVTGGSSRSSGLLQNLMKLSGKPTPTLKK